MKAGIHPKYETTTVSCACGNTFETRSTKSSLRTDLCNVCHPFYTGEQRIVDTAGQVERFMRRVETAAVANRPSKRQSRLAARSERDAQSRRVDLPENDVEASAETGTEGELVNAASQGSGPE